jgi:hypothetical protein
MCPTVRTVRLRVRAREGVQRPMAKKKAKAKKKK